MANPKILKKNNPAKPQTSTNTFNIRHLAEKNEPLESRVSAVVTTEALRQTPTNAVIEAAKTLANTEAALVTARRQAVEAELHHVLVFGDTKERVQPAVREPRKEVIIKQKSVQKEVKKNVPLDVGQKRNIEKYEAKQRHTMAHTNEVEAIIPEVVSEEDNNEVVLDGEGLIDISLGYEEAGREAYAQVEPVEVDMEALQVEPAALFDPEVTEAEAPFEMTAEQTEMFVVVFENVSLQLQELITPTIVTGEVVAAEMPLESVVGEIFVAMEAITEPEKQAEVGSLFTQAMELVVTISEKTMQPAELEELTEKIEVKCREILKALHITYDEAKVEEFVSVLLKLQNLQAEYDPMHNKERNVWHQWDVPGDGQYEWICSLLGEAVLKLAA